MRRRSARLPPVLAGLVAASLVAACLPSTIRPTPTPAPSTPSPSATAAATVRPTPGPPTPVPTPQAVVHVVVPGDTLVSIARTYGTDGRSVAYWNRATYPSLDPDSADYDPNRIEVGWRLTVYPGERYDPDAEQTAPPAPTPQASLSIPPGPTANPSGAAVVVTNGARGGNAVALTFDLGGRAAPGSAVATWLVEHDVPATVFATGSALGDTEAGRAVGRLVAANPDLLTLGNLTWDYPDLTTLGGPAVGDQLRRADDAIAAAIGVRSTPLFRPPFGAHDADVRSAAGAAGWAFLVTWDVDGDDWRPEGDGGPTATDVVAKVVSRAQGGSIIHLNLDGEVTLEALPGIVDELRAAGLEPVTLHRLLGVQPGG